eukprot:1139473-Pelagomonas_calceolata.AAC.5
MSQGIRQVSHRTTTSAVETPHIDYGKGATSIYVELSNPSQMHSWWTRNAGLRLQSSKQATYSAGQILKTCEKCRACKQSSPIDMVGAEWGAAVSSSHRRDI